MNPQLIGLLLNPIALIAYVSVIGATIVVVSEIVGGIRKAKRERQTRSEYLAYRQSR